MIVRTARTGRELRAERNRHHNAQERAQQFDHSECLVYRHAVTI
jgi:hypothetical protein